MKLFTIGFAQKSAQVFFGLVQRPGLAALVDVRLHNRSQLAGFTKQDDLPFFAEKIARIGYWHCAELAPSAEMLADYQKNGRDWQRYERRYLALLKQRRVEDTIPRERVAGGCLLCSEPAPHHCHRRLAAEYLARHWGGVEIEHL